MDPTRIHPFAAPTAAASLPGGRHTLPLADGHEATLYCLTQSVHEIGSAGATPLLVVHSVNATASAFEMEPVVVRQGRRRPVVALDLPGFGASGKPDEDYTPQLMQQAVDAAIDWTGLHLGNGPIDVMALSLGCEFAAEAVLEVPERIRTLTLISPTGMESRRIAEHHRIGATREMAWMRRLLRDTRLGVGLYRLLTTPASIRWFLARSWGSPDVDPRLLEHGLRCASRPGAEHAPLDFVAGALFTPGIIETYRALPVPLWVAHGTEGAFTDFGACPEQSGTARMGGPFPVERTAFPSGAMPHFQLAEAFDAAYEGFLMGQPVPEEDAARPLRAAPWATQTRAGFSAGRSSASRPATYST